MDRNTTMRTRRPEAAQPTARPPRRIMRDRGPQQEARKRPTSGKIREAKDSSEFIRVPRKADAQSRPSVEDDRNARNFYVSNVGRNGTLQLKQSRMSPAQLNQMPATPPGTSDENEPVRVQGSDRWQSFASGTYTPRGPIARGIAPRPSVPMPPPSMENGHQRRRTRSHSFSTIDGSTKSPAHESLDFQILLNGRDTTRRPKSSVDLSEGLMDFRIPHYRIGTPQFSERGTAYLHNSMNTASEVRSSVLSRAEYDKLFPAPPGRAHSSTFIPHSSSALYLHPSAANSLTASRTPPTPPSSHEGNSVSLAVYDRIEAHINDPTVVRYSPTTGRITAATPARLIAQITSPLFLDYELLADFFLTYRNFLSCQELLEYLLSRMKWALANDSDAGRIVRVRTFVALRHWILNYFADDFYLDQLFRQRFCDLVNELAHDLQQRSDGGGTDLSVVGELKKCWRRTCASFWPAPDVLDTSAAADIVAGEGQGPETADVSNTSLPASAQPNVSHMDFRRGSQIQLPVKTEATPDQGQGHGRRLTFSDDTWLPQRTASIPTSPLDEQTLAVLACCVPFLRHMIQLKERATHPRVTGAPKDAPLPDRDKRPTTGHKRSGSFSDALRDQRPPLPSNQPEVVDIQSLRSLTFIGGLVRGLLLQPSPSKLNLLVPMSPGLETQDVYFSGSESITMSERARMRKIVGDVRRVLSSRKEPRETLSSSGRSTISFESRISGQTGRSTRQGHPLAWHQLSGPARVDVLAEKIEAAYQAAFEDSAEPAVNEPDTMDFAVEAHRPLIIDNVEDRPSFKAPDYKRLDSHVTTSSRSIVIANDTGVPDLPVTAGTLPSVSSWSSDAGNSALSHDTLRNFRGDELGQQRLDSMSPKAVANGGQQKLPPEMPDVGSSATQDPRNQDITKGHTLLAQMHARKSSSVHPSAADIAEFRHQLRRRPGGDLKAADHVHDLEPAPRPFTGDSYSTFDQSVISSGEPSYDLSGTHFSGQQYKLQVPPAYPNGQKNDSVTLLPTHSSQPNMRPSFEKQVTHLKTISDRNNNGGIEDALAKLEGTASSPTESEPAFSRRSPDDDVSPRAMSLAPGNASMSAVKSVATESPIMSPKTDRQGASIYHGEDSDSDADSDWSSDGVEDGDAAAETPQAAEPKSLLLQNQASTEMSMKSVGFVEKVKNAQQTDPKSDFRPGSAPKSATPQGSFLLDDNESLSDISTEINDQSGDESLGVRSFFFDDTADDDALPMFTLRSPPSSPLPIGAPATASLDRIVAPDLLLPEPYKPLKEAASAPKLLSSKKPDPKLEPKPAEVRRAKTVPTEHSMAHLPFVVAFESEVIAEQLTIIEKDALDEVDWKDLISLKWQQSPSQVRNWVEFLSKDTANGIDIIIARFNLVVKWVVSECMLTEAPTERARCITKFIHIAANCHRLRNYASMYQITLALLSSDLARLRRTWSLVGLGEKQMLERLEKLCQPLRNFHQLRSEMESVPEDMGCIPFIGLYTHDLMFNAQKPSRIDPPPPGKEQLVNFERYQTAATIVKSLLRLIEASSKYIFHPHPEVLSRCLWLAALEDADITARSKALE